MHATEDVYAPCTKAKNARTFTQQIRGPPPRKLLHALLCLRRPILSRVAWGLGFFKDELESSLPGPAMDPFQGLLKGSAASAGTVAYDGRWGCGRLGPHAHALAARCV